MKGTFLLNTARKAVLARLAALGRRFCQDDINEMASMAIERFLTRGSYYDPSKASVQTYLGRIAAHVVYDFVKTADKARTRFCDIDAPEVSDSSEDDRKADSQLLEEEQDALLESALDRLTPRHQLLFCLLHEETPYPEIASRLDLSVKNVSVEVHRMKKKLQKFVREAA